MSEKLGPDADGDPTGEHSPDSDTLPATVAAGPDPDEQDDTLGDTLAAPDDDDDAPDDGSIDQTIAAPGDGTLAETIAAPEIESDADDEAVTLEAEGRYTTPPGRGTMEIGRGGIGRVLIVMDRHLGREIAVKELLPNVEAGSAGTGGGSSGRVTSPTTARFLREARVTGQLEHPNIVPVYELGQREDGTLYYAMKLVRGRTLSAALDRCGSLEERLDLLPRYVDLCQAIAYAHSRGVIHRDIKTENVMLGEFGETVVLDWGLAKVKGQKDLREGDLQREVQLYHEAGEGHTVAGAAMGTPAYMSPEQAQGELETIDEQSDVWSLGAVLYELLTGRPPHTGRTVLEVLNKVTDEPVTPARDRAPQVPPELAAVAEKALRRNRGARYASAQELAREVEAFQSGARVSSYEYSSWELLQRFVGRNKTLSAATAVLMIVLAVATVLVFQAYRGAESARSGESRARVKAERSGEAERASRVLAQDHARNAHLNLALAFQEKADRLLADHNYTAARIFAAAALQHNPGNPFSPHHKPGRPLSDPKAARDGIVAAQSTLFSARMYQAFHLKGRFTGAGGDIKDVTFFPDGRRLAAASKSGRVLIWSVPEGKKLRVLKAGPPVSGVAVSPDGRWVAGACGDGKIRLWDPDNGKLLATLAGHRSAAVSVVFSPDGATLATSGLDSHVRLWDLKTHKELAALRHRDSQVWDVAFSPDGRTLASVSFKGTSHVNLWDVKTRKSLARMTGHFGPAWSVAFSPDGKEVATGGVDNTVRLWSVAQRRQVGRLKHHKGDVTSVVYSRKGPFLISTSVDRSVVLWLRPTRAVVASHRAHRNHIWDVAVSPDGLHLATGSFDGEARLWEVRPRGCVNMHFSMEAPLFGLRYTARGDFLLAVVGNDVKIFAPLLGTLVGRLKGHSSSVSEVATSPDGRWVATASLDKTARIWDLKTRQTRAVLKGHSKLVKDVAFSPDGKLLATASFDGRVRLWTVPEGKPVAILEGHTKGVDAVAFSQDGKLLASTSNDGAIRIWRLKDKKQLRKIQSARGQDKIAFVRGDRWLLSAGLTSTIHVWDPHTGRAIKKLKHHDSEVFRLRVTPDRRYVVSVGRDNRVIIWSMKTARPVQSMKFDMLPLGVDMRPDGTGFAITLGTPLHIFPFEPALWKKDPKALLERAQNIANLELRRFRLVARK